MAVKGTAYSFEDGYTLTLHGSPIGEGTAARVYLGRIADKKNEIECAIKKFHHATGSFAAEVLAYKALYKDDHPNFLDCYFSGYHDPKREVGILALEYFYGKPLCSYTLSARRIVEVTKELVDAFVHLEKIGVVHGDMKPDNVLYDGKRVKVIDLGAGFLIDEESEDWCSYGYKSPAALHKKKFSFEADRWAVGAVVYFMVIKSHLFAFSTQHARRLEEAMRKLRFTYYPTKRRDQIREIVRIKEGLDERSLEELAIQHRSIIGCPAPPEFQESPRCPKEPLPSIPSDWEARFQQGYAAARPNKTASRNDPKRLESLAAFFARCVQWNPQKLYLQEGF